MADWLSTLGLGPAQSRMPQMCNPNTLGPQFFSAGWEDQRHYLGTGFDGADSADATHYPADPRKAQRDPSTPGAPADANCGRLTRRADGSCEAIRLEATGDGWIDTGGTRPRDMKVVNW